MAVSKNSAAKAPAKNTKPAKPAPAPAPKAGKKTAGKKSK